MKFFGILLLLCATTLCAQSAKPNKKQLLAIGEEKGYRHEAVSHALATIERLGHDSGLWDSTIRTDTEALSKKKLEFNAKNLNDFDAVRFFTAGELEMDAQQKADLLSFIHDEGKGLIGVHSATITFTQWPEYGEMIGDYFDQHPWGTFEAPILVEDPAFPGMQQWPRSFILRDEIYQVKNYSREKVRVLMRLDPTKLDLKNKNVHRTDGDFAVTWAKSYGKGRVFYSSLGHVPRKLGQSQCSEDVLAGNPVGRRTDRRRHHAPCAVPRTDDTAIKCCGHDVKQCVRSLLSSGSSPLVHVGTAAVGRPASEASGRWAA